MVLNKFSCLDDRHSTRSIDEFTELYYKLEAAADVRKLPGSRRLPHFDQDALSKHLQQHGVEASCAGRSSRARAINRTLARCNALFRGVRRPSRLKRIRKRIR